MIRKILYGVGGIAGLLVLFGFIVATPDQPPMPDTEVVKEIESTADKPSIVIDTLKPGTLAKLVEVTKAPPVPERKPQPVPVEATPTQFYAVTQVVDGDTIKIRMSGTIETLRMIGIDSPESVDPRTPVQCFGKEASSHAKELLFGKRVRIETDTTQATRDKYGRLLVYAYREDGLFFNKQMIEDGYAYEYTYNTPYNYRTEFKAAQRSAESSGKGLWSPDTCNGQADPVVASAGGKYYTSSHYSAKYYYPESCEGWKSLSPTYLKAFDSLEALLAAYKRTLSPQCE